MKKSICGLRPRWVFLVFGVMSIALFSSIFVKDEEAAQNISENSVPETQNEIQIEPPRINEFPFAVVIENSIDARPVSGLSKASLVWEAPVEAGVTRFLALYSEDADVSKIGPVRSARPYFVDWAEEVGALFVHVGGSPEALDLIPSRDITDLNEFWNDRYFWRARNRVRPHNTYISTELLRAAARDKKFETKTIESWKYKNDDPPEERGDVREGISLSFGTPAYGVDWLYDFEKNEYVRAEMINEVYVDDDGKEVRAKNVIMLFTDISIIDDVGRRRIRTLGQGTAFLFRDGKRIDGIWKKENLAERTKFFDEDGNELELNVGLTWIEIANYEF